MICISEAQFADRIKQRPAGYEADVRGVAQFSDGKVCLSDKDALWLREKYSRPRPGLGDLVASIATPIARAFRLPCIDPETKQLRPESGCAKRKAALNAIRLPTSNP